MKRIILTVLTCLTLGALAPLSAQDLTITNARIVVANGTVIERGSIVVRGGKIVSVAAGAPAAAAGQDHRRQRHDRDARVHRCAPAHQYRTQREGADAGAARSRLHDHSVRRRSGGRQHHAPGSHREGRHQRTAHHPVRALEAEQQHAGNGSRRDPQDGRDGNQVYRRDRADAGAGAERKRNRSSQGRRGRRRRRPA